MTLDKWKCSLFLILLAWLSSSLAFHGRQPKNQSIFSPTPHAVLKSSHAVLQLGYYWSIQGAQQHINIEDLVGDTFTVTNHGSNNGLVGLGYYIDGQQKDRFKMAYGINAFYLAKTEVAGNVIQGSRYANLSYQYSVTHFPVYAVVKTIVKTHSPKYGLTLDVGIGPNFMSASGFHEAPLYGGITPDEIFASHTTTTFTATVGAGIRFNHVLGRAPVECGYRFFYLGQGHFNAQTEQVQNLLNTGTVYANAVTCAIII